GAYVDRLRAEPDELAGLGDEMLVTVTSFFRDAAVFEKLEARVVPELFRDKADQDDVRVWSVGCATGEEAYSLAILLQEEAGRHKPAPALQVFATDLHAGALHQAREGRYLGNIEQDMSAERLKLFFHKEEGGYKVRRDIREMLVFAQHNLLADPPFSRLDLISCRNLLIYLQRGIQDEVIELFHYALKPDGVLVLGSSETLEATGLFVAEDKKHGIYRKRNVPVQEPRLTVFPRRSAPGIGPSSRPIARPSMSYGQLHEQIVERYALPSVLVSPDDKVVHVSSQAGRYLEHPAGEPTTSILKVVREA